MTKAALQEKLHGLIDSADAKTLREVNNLFEQKAENPSREWWKATDFVREMDERYEDVISGKDKGYTLAELNMSIENHRKRKHGK